MNMESSFTQDGTILWDKAKKKSPDLSHRQGAMFLDRPDLWPHQAKGKRPGTKPLPGQIPFAFHTEGMKTCSGPNCPIKRGEGK